MNKKLCLIVDDNNNAWEKLTSQKIIDGFNGLSKVIDAIYNPTDQNLANLARPAEKTIYNFEVPPRRIELPRR